MAADLDQRSPDASQWGVGASNSVVGVRGRDGSSGRGCSRTNRGAVGASSTAGGADGSTGNAASGCWPNRARGRGMAGAEVWGPTTASGAEGSEVVMNSSNWGVVADHETERPAPRERSRVRGRSAVSAERSRVRGRSAAAAGGTIGTSGSRYCCSPVRGGVADRRREAGEEVSASNNNTSSSKGKAPTRSSRRDDAGKFVAEQGRRHEELKEDDGRGSDLSNRENSSLRTRSRGVGGGAGSGPGPAGIVDVQVAAACGGSSGADIMDTDSVYDGHCGYDNERIDGAGTGEDPAVSRVCGQSAASVAGAGLGDVSDGDAAVSDMDAATGGHGEVPGGSGRGGGSGGTTDFVARAASERLAFKLSVNLIDTYKLINQRYYAEKNRQQEQSAAAATGNRGGGGGGGGGSKPAARQGGVYNHGLDDENFDYIVHEGEVFNGRYAVRETIGKGSFGKVYKAWDEKNKTYVALKVIKSKRPFTMQARVEVEILEMLRERDPDGKYNCARMLDEFMSHNHQCLVFEILSFNLYELLRSTQFQGVSLHLVRKFARHLLRALAFLSLPQVDVIHCDLKPENILLQHPKRSNIKVIDFGSSCRSHNKMYSYIQSRFYRSPEVMLGLPYTTAIDMWSLGCILVEMHTGEPLFAGVDQFDQMCRIVSVIGMTPPDVVERSPHSHRDQFFEVDSSSEDRDDTGSNSDGSDSEGESMPRAPKARVKKTRTSGVAWTPRRGNNAQPRGAAGARAVPEDGATAGWSSEDAGSGVRQEVTDNRGGGSSGGRRDAGAASTTDADSDDDMADHFLGSESPSAEARRPFHNNQRRRYRLRRHMLLKRARNAGKGASGVKDGKGSGSRGTSSGEGWAAPPRVPLSEVVGVNSGGPSGRREGEAGHDPETYGLFVNLVERMLDHRPETRITPAEALRHPFLEDPPPSHVPPKMPNAIESSAVESWLGPNNSFASGSGTDSYHREHPTTPASVADSGGDAAVTTVGIAESDTPLPLPPPPRGGAGIGSSSDNGGDDDDDRGRGEGLGSSSVHPTEQRPRSAPEGRGRGGRGGRRGGCNSGGSGSGSGSASMVDVTAADVGRGRRSPPEGSENNHDGSLTGGGGVAPAAAALADQSAERRNRYRGHGNAHDREVADGGPRTPRLGSGGSSSGGISWCGSGVSGEKGSGGGSSSSGGGRGGGKGAGASRSGSGSNGRFSGVRRVRGGSGDSGGSGGSGATCDSSAKRPGQRSRKEPTHAAAGDVGSDPPHAGQRRRTRNNQHPAGARQVGPVLSPTRATGGAVAMETRRGRAVRRGQGRLPGEVGGRAAAEGHVEATSGVAELSLHSSRSGSRRYYG